MSRLHALTFCCFHLLLSWCALAQTNSPTPSLAQASVAFVLNNSSVNSRVLVADTGKPLPADGHWSIATTRPAACPQTDAPCARVLYSVPEEKVTCEWVVLPPAGTVQGQILNENDSASQYLLRRLSASETAPLVKSRAKASCPPIAAAAHVSGDIVVRVVVDPAGEVLTVVPLSGPEMLRATALDAIKQWTFNPLTAGTRPLSFTTEITASFITKGPPSGTIKFRP